MRLVRDTGSRLVRMEDRLFTLAEAATLCGRAKSTLTRARAAGKFPNAQQDSDGRWLIPFSDLAGAHFLDRVAPGSAEDSAPSTDGEEHTSAATDYAHQREIDALRHQLELAQVRLHQAHLLIEAKDTTISAMETALRALEAGHHENPTTPTPEHPEDPAPGADSPHTPHHPAAPTTDPASPREPRGLSRRLKRLLGR